MTVGSCAANQFGLYDIHGNVWEWFADRYGEKYFETSPVDDPTGPGALAPRVLRVASCSPLKIVRPWQICC